jgi:formimidoylglutamate deiminase
MAVIFAKQALLPSGWADNVQVEIEQGLISRITPNSIKSNGDAAVDTLLPALANVHSHSFQRFMSGMTEHRSAGKDNFWSWRDLMYRFAGRMTPDDIEAVAAQVFMEMQEAGYASVGEFHYVHHQQGGAHYDDIAELSHRIFAAAANTGIGLTHLPVLYRYGGAGKAPLSDGQLRFGNSIDQFLKLFDAAQQQLAQLPDDCRMGIAPHSLRATSPEDLNAVLAAYKGGPVHIHIAEQTKEVDDVQAWLGAKPVEWLLNNFNIDANWCLIHATHMSESETVTLAKSGAVAGLCPITEANLGDGIFNGADYLNAGGAFGIGSDSNVQIALGGELRMLEYSQRLRDRARNMMVVREGSIGHTLYTKAAIGGAQALGRNAGAIEIGRLADLVAVDSTAPQLCALTQNQLLDGLVFAAKDDVVSDVWSAGRHVVKDGRHFNREAIIANYKKAAASLLGSI